MNRYSRSSALSERQFRALVRLVAADLAATQIAQVSGLNRNTVNRYLRLIRESMSPLIGFGIPMVRLL